VTKRESGDEREREEIPCFNHISFADFGHSAVRIPELTSINNGGDFLQKLVHLLSAAFVLKSAKQIEVFFWFQSHLCLVYMSETVLPQFN